MVKGLYTAYTGMLNEQNRMDIMTNNLANASTVGYKKEGSTSQSFDDVLTVKIKDQSVGMRNAQKIGIKNPGVKIGENYTDYSQDPSVLPAIPMTWHCPEKDFCHRIYQQGRGDRYQVYPCRTVYAE